MIVRETEALTLLDDNRLDANYYCSPGRTARDLIDRLRSGSTEVRSLGDIASSIWAPLRFKRAYAADQERALGYLRPYDVFEYLPQAADRLSIERTANLDSYRIRPGMILQTCSGRNLGPATLCDTHLSNFLLSHDMIRIEIDEPLVRSYVIAFMNCPTGQSLIRRNRAGSVIDHLTAPNLTGVHIPFVGGSVQSAVADLTDRAHRIRDHARLELAELIEEINERWQTTVPGRLATGWEVARVDLSADRLDSAYYTPQVASTRSALDAKGGSRLGDLADVTLPGRYVRRYVRPEFGTATVSGRQLLQHKPVNLQYLADSSFRRPDDYRLRPGMIAMQAEGRAEGRIGQPVLISSDRGGWYANNHVARITPHPGVHPGSLYLAIASYAAQQQIEASACGSVVDAVPPRWLGAIWLPPLHDELGERALVAWEAHSTANELDQQAVSMLQQRLVELESIRN